MAGILNPGLISGCGKETSSHLLRLPFSDILANWSITKPGNLEPNSVQREVGGMRGAYKDSSKLSLCPVSDRMWLAMMADSLNPSVMLSLQGGLLYMFHWLSTRFVS